MSRAVLAGLAITMIALVTDRWTSFAYFADVAPLVLLLPILTGKGASGRASNRASLKKNRASHRLTAPGELIW